MLGFGPTGSLPIATSGTKLAQFSGTLEDVTVLATAIVPVHATVSSTLGDVTGVIVALRGSFASITVTFRAATKIKVSRIMGPIHVGDTNDIDAEFLDVHTNELIDPTTVHLLVQTPTQAIIGAYTTYTYGVSSSLVRLSTGKYRASVPCTMAGTWLFTWLSPGPLGKGAEPGYFDVDAALPT